MRSQLLVFHGVKPLEELSEIGSEGERAFQGPVARKIGFEAAAPLGCVKNGTVSVIEGNDGQFMWFEPFCVRTDDGVNHFLQSTLGDHPPTRPSSRHPPLPPDSLGGGCQRNSQWPTRA